MNRLLLLIAILTLPLIASGQEFGRLFTSTAERRALDALRANEVPLAIPAPVEVTEQAPTLDTPTVELNFSGFIRRADGSYAIWVNGKSELSKTNSPIDRARFEEERPYATLQVDRKQASMKPGQIWSLGNNTIREGYYAKRVQKPTAGSPASNSEEAEDEASDTEIEADTTTTPPAPSP